MILDDATKLTQDLERLQDLRRGVRREEDLEERTRRISQVTEKFVAPQAFLDLAREEGLGHDEFDTLLADRTALAVERLMLGSSNDPTRVLGNALDDAIRNAEVVARALKATATGTWRDAANYDHWLEQDELMALLNTEDPSTQFGRIVRKLAGLATRIVDLVKLDLPTRPQYETWKALVEDYERSYATLFTDLSDDVEVFLRAAHSRGAALPLLTEHVHDWLTVNNLLERYVIRPTR